MSGMTVKRAVSSLRRNQAIFSREERAAVSSGPCFSTAHSAFKDESKVGHTRKGADVFEFGSEPHFGEEAAAPG